MREITLQDAEISFIKLASYEGTESTGDVKELIGISDNISGRNISKLTDRNYKEGYHSINWNASGYASGVYFVKMTSGDFVNTQKLILLK